MLRSLPRTVYSASRQAAITTRRYASGSNMHENDPETIEREMKRKFDHATESVHQHAPGWNETLASESEANVKAEKHEGKPSTESTVQYIKKRHHTEESSTVVNGAGSSKRSLHTSSRSFAKPDEVNNEDDNHTKAPYEREEVKGPLGELGPKEKLEKRKKTTKAQGQPSNAGTGTRTPSEDAVKADRGET